MADLVIKEDRHQRNRERISPLKPKLKPYHVRLDCYKDYAAIYLNPQLWPKKYEKFNFEKINKHDNFKAWRESKSSHMLLLCGRSHMNCGYHWLSAAALYLLQILDQNENATGHRPLFIFLHPEPWLPDNIHVPQTTAMSLLIWQFLEQFPEISEDTNFFESLEEKIEREEWLAVDCSEQYDVLKDLLSRRAETNIIIDRLDSCACPVDIFVQNLLVLLSQCSSMVRIFAVLSGPFEVDDLVSSHKRRLSVITMDQQRR